VWSDAVCLGQLYVLGAENVSIRLYLEEKQQFIIKVKYQHQLNVESAINH